MSDWARFVEGFQQMLEAYDKRLNERQASAWWEALKDLPLGDLQQAMRELPTSSERLPSLAALRTKALSLRRQAKRCETCGGSGQALVRRRARSEAERDERYGWQAAGSTHDDLETTLRKLRPGYGKLDEVLARLPPEGIPPDSGRYPEPCPDCRSGDRLRSLSSAVEHIDTAPDDDDERRPGSGSWSWDRAL